MIPAYLLCGNIVLVMHEIFVGGNDIAVYNSFSVGLLKMSEIKKYLGSYFLDQIELIAKLILS